jgi:sugar lactone lactonase YvrE
MATRETTVLLDGLAFVESPRWRDDRLWFSHWGTEEIVAVDLDGKSEVVGCGPADFGLATVAARRPHAAHGTGVRA